MDLLGRKAKKAQELAEAQLDVALAWIADLQNRLDENSLKLTVQQGALDRLAAEVHEKTAVARELEAALNARPSKSPYSLHKSEEEEELDYALRNGDIDLSQYRDLLKMNGFDNAEVEIPERAERPIVY